jgi:hypothetical protein
VGHFEAPPVEAPPVAADTGAADRGREVFDGAAAATVEEVAA